MRLHRLAALAAAAMLAFAPIALHPAASYAQAAVTAPAAAVAPAVAPQPATVIVAADTKVSVPWGDWVGQVLGLAASIIAVVLGGILTWAARLLPAWLRAFVTKERTDQVEQLLQHAIDWGLNAVAGAARGQTLEVNVGSQVVAEAAQYAVDHGPEKLVNWMGGAEGIKEKIIARIPLVPDATANEVLAKTPIIRKAA